MTSYCRRLFLWRLTIAVILTVSRSSFLLADVLTCSSTTITIRFDYEPKVLVYPGSGVYPISVTCRWLFQAKASDFTFFLRFKSPIAIGSETFNIYDGPDATSTKLFGSGGITSGTDGNFRSSTTDKVFMEFTSDTTSSPSETGFTLEIGNGKDTSGCSTPSTSQTITLSSSPYFLTSPSFPSSNYPVNTNCTWTFTTSDPSSIIVVRFLYQDFDKAGKCYDTVKVYEGSTVLQAALIESQLCDDIFLSTDTRNTTGNSVTVDFYSDNFVVAKGFSALVFEIGADSYSSTITSSLITQSTSSSTTSETATDKTASTTESTAILKYYTTTTSTSSSSNTESTAAPKDYTTTSTSSSSVSESTATHYTTSTSSTTESTSESTYTSAALQSSTPLSIVTTDSTAKNVDSTTSFYVATSTDEEAGTDPVLIGACVACVVALVGVVAIVAGKQLLGKASSVELAIVEAVKSYPSVDIGHTQPKFYTSNLVIDVPNK